MKKVGSWKPILKNFASWKPIWGKKYKLESDLEKLAKLEAFFEIGVLSLEIGNDVGSMKLEIIMGKWEK